MKGKEPKLVEYECSCVGFAPDADGNALIIKPCDTDGPCMITFVLRPMLVGTGPKLKRYEPYTCSPDGLKQPENLLLDIQELIRDGYRWQQLKRDLNSD